MSPWASCRTGTAPVLRKMSLPEHVQPLSDEGKDVQELFARARVLVTDYSSIAFNAAYLEHPVVHYQFDADKCSRVVTWDDAATPTTTRDGFGPGVDSHGDDMDRRDAGGSRTARRPLPGVPSPDRRELHGAGRSMLRASR